MPFGWESMRFQFAILLVWGFQGGHVSCAFFMRGKSPPHLWNWENPIPLKTSQFAGAIQNPKFPSHQKYYIWGLAPPKDIILTRHTNNFCCPGCSRYIHMCIWYKYIYIHTGFNIHTYPHYIAISMGFNHIFFCLSFIGMLSLWPNDALPPSLVSRKVLQPERPEAAFGLQRQPGSNPKFILIYISSCWILLEICPKRSIW